MGKKDLNRILSPFPLISLISYSEQILLLRNLLPRKQKLFLEQELVWHNSLPVVFIIIDLYCRLVSGLISSIDVLPDALAVHYGLKI